MQSDELKRRISAGRGDALADLVLKNARIVNVFTDEIDTADIAISGNSIVGVGTYHGRKEVDLHGKYVCPGQKPIPQRRAFGRKRCCKCCFPLRPHL